MCFYANTKASICVVHLRGLQAFREAAFFQHKSLRVMQFIVRLIRSGDRLIDRIEIQARSFGCGRLI